MKILIIDNYDSFTYNLVHYIEGLGAEVDVVFNNEINFKEVNNYDKIILSPGPGLPEDAGDMPQLIQEFINKKPILGVCLGFQAIIEFFGGTLFNQKKVKHGVSENCFFENNSQLFIDTAPSFKVGLYHSWAADPKTFPKALNITSKSEEGIIMAFEHQTLSVFGVQFHPESIMSEYGHQILKNFLLT